MMVNLVDVNTAKPAILVSIERDGDDGEALLFSNIGYPLSGII
jgi:hypothetical protein